MDTGVAQMVIQRVFEGSISLNDMEKERPYHKYCGCALHPMKSTICSNACPKQICISFPKKKSWRECSMSKTASIFSSQSSLPKTRQCHSDNQGEFVEVFVERFEAGRVGN